MPDVSSVTESVLDHHLGAFVSKDLDQLLSDFTEESVLIGRDATYKGLDAIRGFFAPFLESFTPEMIDAFNMQRQDIQGEYAYIVWDIGDIAPLGTDTFHIVDGKIMMQSFAAYMPG